MINAYHAPVRAIERFLILVLSVLLVATMLPTVALAADIATLEQEQSQERYHFEGGSLR